MSTLHRRRGAVDPEVYIKQIVDAADEPDAVTPVIFRRFPKEYVRNAVTGKHEWIGGDVVAIFPTLPGGQSPSECTSYQHVGQHGACDGRGLVYRTHKATPEEYADLKAELEAGPFYYRLTVYVRWQQLFDEVRHGRMKYWGAS